MLDHGLSRHQIQQQK